MMKRCEDGINVFSLSLYSASCWPSGFFRTCQSSLRSGSSDSRRAMTRLSSDPGMRPPRCSLSEGRFCTWRFTEDQPFVRWVLLLNVLLNLPKPATIFLLEHYGLLTGRVQLFHNKYTQSTHTSIPHEYVKHIRTHRDKTFGFGTAYLGQYFPAKDCPEASSWIFLNAFKFLRCGPFPKFGAMGQEQPPPDHIDPPAKLLDVSARQNLQYSMQTWQRLGLAARQSCQSWRGNEKKCEAKQRCIVDYCYFWSY